MSNLKESETIELFKQVSTYVKSNSYTHVFFAYYGHGVSTSGAGTFRDNIYTIDKKKVSIDKFMRRTKLYKIPKIIIWGKIYIEFDC